MTTLTRDLGLTTAADAIDVEREAVLMETLGTQRPDGIDDRLRLDLRDTATHGANLMAMAIAIVAGLITRGGLNAMANDQTQLHEELQRVIEGGPAHAEVVFIDELIAKLFEREMPGSAIDRIEDGIALRRLPVLVQF